VRLNCGELHSTIKYEEVVRHLEHFLIKFNNGYTILILPLGSSVADSRNKESFSRWENEPWREITCSLYHMRKCRRLQFKVPELRIRSQLEGKVVPVHAMNAYGGGGGWTYTSTDS
jgi:hypothetical protein